MTEFDQAVIDDFVAALANGDLPRWRALCARHSGRPPATLVAAALDAPADFFAALLACTPLHGSKKQAPLAWRAAMAGNAQLQRVLGAAAERGELHAVVDEIADTLLLLTLVQVRPPHVVDAVATLLAAGAPVDAADQRGQQALHLAAQRSALALVQLLLQRGAAVDARSHRGDTPLLLAAASAELPVLEALLDAGADVNAVNDSQQHVVWAAVRAGQLDALRLFLSRGCVHASTPDRDNETPLVHASRRGYTDIIHTLLDAGADIDQLSCMMPGWTPLMLAVHHKHFDATVAVSDNRIV